MIKLFRIPVVVVVVCLLAGCSEAEPTLVTSHKPNELIGVASVIDGDTIVIHDQKVRFDGMDSPESGSRCGEVNVYKAGADALHAKIGQAVVTCQLTGKKNGDRVIGTCFARGENLSEFVVREGWGRDWPKYSNGRFSALEAEARASFIGIWGLECPEDLWGNRNYD